MPLKFELFAGTTELTDRRISIATGYEGQLLERSGDRGCHRDVATGGTSLRYDATGGQFIYNWKTPTGAGTCHKVTMTAKDGSTITAYFKMK